VRGKFLARFPGSAGGGRRSIGEPPVATEQATESDHPPRFTDANISVRKYSTLRIGSMYPVHRRSLSPAFQNLCGSPAPNLTVSPGPAYCGGWPSLW
jgi:hypothetical protein